VAQYCPLCSAYLTRPELHPTKVWVDERGFTHKECRMISPANYVSEDELADTLASILGERTT
jgi:hypothetical protein